MADELDLLQPYWLLLLLLPLLWLVWRRYRPHSWPQLLPLPTMRYPLLAELQRTEDVVLTDPGNRRADWLLALAMCLMALALSQPVRYIGQISSGKTSEPVDLVLVVGTAISMSLHDYVVNGQRVDRMTMTRHSLDGFVNEFSGSRISLVILGNPPALWVPLTTDKAVVRDAISRIQPVLGGRLTDMGSTLQLVRESFPVPRDTVVVVISDGGLQLGAVSPVDAARALASAGFSLYAIAIGSADPDAGDSRSGELLYDPADIGMLRQMAETGGGKMFHALDTQAFIEALAEIEAQHRRPVPAPQARRLVEPWYPVPLAFSMLLLIAAIRKGGRPRRHPGQES